MTRRRLQAGLSLIELMVSITLGLMILSGVLVVFVNSSAARSEVERTSRQIENGRYASELLTEDLRLAGFYGELNVGSLGATGLPADPCSLTPADWRSWIPVHLQGYDDTGFASPNCALTNLKPNTDVLVVRRARACVAGVAGCDAAVNGKPYLQVSLCGSQVSPNNLRLGLEGTQTFDMQKKTCLTTALANKREYLVRIYFIATDNGSGENIPTLKRLELTGTGWSTVPLVEGIEELQLHYGIDYTCDGQPDVYVSNPTVYTPPPPPPAICTAGPVDNWTSVVTVQFHLLARNLETSPGYTDTKRYILGKDDAGVDIERTPGGSFRRHVYTGLVRVANPSGRRDTP